MKSAINIPKTIEEATGELNGLAGLLTAKKWERAAIVYAFTEPQQGKRNFGGIPSKLTITEFANLKISGLTQREDVAFYRKCWEAAIDDGQATDVVPGDTVVLPERDWPPFHRSGTEKERVERAIRNNPAIVAEALSENPEPVVDAILEAAPQHDPLSLKLGLKRAYAKEEERLEREDREGPPPAREEREPDYDTILRHSVSGLSRVMQAMRDDRWEPGALEKALLYFTVKVLEEMVGGEPVPDSLFKEIEQHLEVSRS